MSQCVLMITAISGAENCAASIAKQLGIAVEIAPSRRAGLATLRRREFTIVVVDSSVAEADPECAELLWKHAGLAIPLEINFALSGSNRLVREVRAALARREQEQALAMRAAATVMESELRDTVAGLLLQSQLALSEPSMSPQVALKLRAVADLAVNLRQRLEHPQPAS